MVTVEEIDITGLGSQASLASGVPNTGTAGHSMVWFGGQNVITGAVSSITVIVCTQGSDLFPQASRNTQVRVILYSWGHTPLGVVTVEEIDTTGLGSQASLASGIPKTGVAGHSIVVFDGQNVIVGDSLSVTVIVCEQGADTFPQASRKTQVRVTLYSCGQSPGAVTIEETDITGAVSQTSLAVGIPNSGVAGHSIV